MNGLGPAFTVLTVGVGAILAADEELIRRGRRPVTDVLRTPPGIVFLVLLAGHVAGVLGRWDPFRAIQTCADRLDRWVMPGRVLP